jgi:flagellar biosynthetic protein FliR
MPADLRPLLDHLSPWLMVFFRLTGVFVLAPVLGSSTVPRIVKALLALGLSFCVYPVLLEPGTNAASMVGPMVGAEWSMWSLVPAIGRELLVGFAIGYAASLPLMAMQVAGHMIGQQMGLAFATIVNPVFNDQASIVDQVFFILGLTIFVILGGHHMIFAAVVASFQNIPLGGFDQIGALLDLVLGLIMVMFDTALRIAAPMLCLVFLVTAVMGFIARTVPQMNILSVGFAIRIMSAGLFLVIFMKAGGEIFVNTLEETFHTIMNFFGP